MGDRIRKVFRFLCLLIAISVLLFTLFRIRYRDVIRTLAQTQVRNSTSDLINKAIDQAVAESVEKGIHGKNSTPFLLARVAELTGGDSLASNIRLVYNNAKVAALTAVAYCEM